MSGDIILLVNHNTASPGTSSYCWLIQWRKSRGGQGGYVPSPKCRMGDGYASCPPKYGGNFVA